MVKQSTPVTSSVLTFLTPLCPISKMLKPFARYHPNSKPVPTLLCVGCSVLVELHTAFHWHRTKAQLSVEFSKVYCSYWRAPCWLWRKPNAYWCAFLSWRCIPWSERRVEVHCIGRKRSHVCWEKFHRCGTVPLGWATEEMQATHCHFVYA